MNVLDQIQVELTQPSIIPFALAYISGFFVYHIRARRKMLAMKAAMDGFYALYLLMIHAYAGAFGLGIAMLGGIVQIATPDHLMKKTLPYRLAGATLLATIGAYLTMRRTSDALPLIATVISRFFETQASPQRIRLLMLIPLTMWIIYSLDRQFYLLTFAQITLMASQMFAVFNVHKETQKSPS
jgi:hypothetical protein